MGLSAAYIEQERAGAAGMGRALGAFCLVLLAVAVIGHRRGLVETPPFLWLLALGGALAVLALLSCLAAYVRIWVRGDLGAGAATAGLLFALVALAPFAFAFYLVLTLPPLIDVSTDWQNPPAMAAASRTAAMNPLVESIPADLAAEQRKAYPDVTGRLYVFAFDRTLDTLLPLAAARGWKPVDRSETVGEIDAVTLEYAGRDWLLSLPFDISLRVRNTAEGAYVDMRSASRYGSHDLGSNAARIRSFLQDLDAAIAPQASLEPPADEEAKPPETAPAPPPRVQ